MSSKNRSGRPETADALDQLKQDREKKYALIFGNEATGLPEWFQEEGQSVRIRHTEHIDSLNLSLAAGIAIYEFTKK